MSIWQFSRRTETTLWASILLGWGFWGVWIMIDYGRGGTWYDVDLVQRPPPQFLVDLATASEAELGLLPDIGPQLAQRIVAARQQGMRFQSAEDLQRVRGIGPKRRRLIEPYLTVPSIAPHTADVAGQETSVRP
jgi:hypothetical protein